MSKKKWSMLAFIIMGIFVVEIYLISKKQPHKNNFYKMEKSVTSISPDSLEAIPSEISLPSSRDTIRLTWLLLSNIDYINKVTQLYPEGLLNPVINGGLKDMKGQHIKISGYAIPLDDESFALSENVMAACFFCGMGGPESVMGIEFQGKTPKLKTDQFITLLGTFDYNETDPDDWIYHIKNATLLKK